MARKSTKKQVEKKQENVPLELLALWTRRMSLLFNAGCSLTRALNIMAEDTTNGPMCQISTQLDKRIWEGSTLSGAMEEFGEVLDAYYVGVVKYGEVGGIMDIAFNRLVDRLERQIAFAAPRPGLPTRVYLSEWCWWLSNLGDAGVSSLGCMTTLAVSSISPLREITEAIANEVAAGGRHSDIMKQYETIFTPILVQMMAISEEYGDMAARLKQAAAHLDYEARYESSGWVPPLWSAKDIRNLKLPTITPAMEHPAVRKLNELIIIAISQEIDSIRFSPSTGDQGVAVFSQKGQEKEPIALDEYSRLVRRVKIMAEMDPFSRQEARGEIHIRHKDQDYSMHIYSRPAQKEFHLYMSIGPKKVMETE
jgi:hypothetical protein